MAQPLILTLLGIPIKLINFITCLLGSIFYAPSYIYFLLIKSIVFNEQHILTKGKYISLWLPRFVLLSLGFYLFILQFYYSLRWYWQHDQQTGFKLKCFSLVISTGGFLFLMRRGYIKSIKYLNVPPLKSPKQHLYQFGLMLTDLSSIFLGLVNIMLISHSLLTFKYYYHPRQKNFFPHITNLVGSSLLYNFQKPACIYLKIFPWRLRQSQDFKKQHEYTLERSIIIFFILINTNIDLLLFSTIGWIPFLSPWKSYKRYIRYLQNNKCYSWRRAIIKSSLLTISQYIQLLFFVLSIPFNFSTVIKIYKQTKRLKTHLNQTDAYFKYIYLDQIYLSISFFVFIQSILSIFTFIARVIVFLSVYKEKKFKKYTRQTQQKNIQQNKGNKGNKDDANDSQGFLKLNEYFVSLQAEKYKFLYALQFIIDIPFWLLSIVNVVIKPFQYKFLTRLLDENYDLKRKRIVQKVIHGVVLYLTAVLLIILLPFYLHRLPEIQTWAKNPTEQQKKLSKMKQLQNLAIKIIKSTGSDLNSLLLWYTMFVFGLSSTPLNAKDLRQDYESLTLQFQILYRRTLISLVNKDLLKFLEYDKQYLTSAILRLKFWRTLHKIKNFRSIANFLKIPIFLTYYLKSYYIKKIKQIRKNHEQLKISEISKQLSIQKQIISLSLKLNLRIIVEILLSLVSIVLVMLSLWRLPTLIIFFKNKKYNVFKSQGQPTSLAMFKTLVFVFIEQIKDILFSPLYLIAFILCPLRFIKYFKKFSYQYQFNDLNQLKWLMTTKRKYFLRVILLPSLNNVFYIIQILFIYITIFRINYLRALLNKQHLKLRTFFYHTIGIEQLPPLQNYQDINSNQILRIKDTINYASIQASRDVTFLPFYIFPLLFPYRIMHIIHIWNTNQIPKNDNYQKAFISGRRKLIVQLVGRIIRDDLISLLLTITLLFSVIRTHRAIFLISRNLRRNLTIKFLIYDYKKELVQENILLLKDIQAILQSILILLYVVRVKTTIRRCKQLHKQHIEDRKAEQQFIQIQQTTKKLKQSQTFGAIGYGNFKSICQYLQPNDIHHLSRTSKDIYLWCEEEEMWEEMWNNRYASTGEKSNKHYKQKCIDQYLRLKPPKQKQLTYHTIVAEQLYHSMKYSFSFQRLFNFKLITGQWIGPNVYREQFQRYPLISAVLLIPIELIIRVIHPYFISNNYRYFKQGIVIIFISTLILSSLFIGWNLLLRIYQSDKYIAIYTLLFVYIYSFNLYAISQFYRSTMISPALHPFDLPYIIFVVIKKVSKAIYAWISDKSTKTYNFVLPKIKKVANFVKDKFVAVGNMAKKAAEKLFEKIANALRSLKDFLVSGLKALKKLITQFFNIFKMLFTGFKNILKFFGRGYLGVLTLIMNFFLPLGIIGDLIFTILALLYFGIPLILCYLFYWKSITIIPSTILTLITIIKGYNTIKVNYEKIKPN